MGSLKYRIIAFDLDGTLLTTDKRVSAANAEALRRAAEAGAYIVPATGRILKGIPAEILGELCPGRDKLLRQKEHSRCLDRPQPDSLQTFLAGRGALPKTAISARQAEGRR